MTLMRLRFNMNTQYIAFVFDIHVSTVSRIFTNVLNLLYTQLVPLTVRCPAREELRKTMPRCFKEKCPKCSSVKDCFEVFIEKPSSFSARSQTYSHYKAHNTVKYLISISPQGTITFISKGWGGRTSDKELTEKSGYLRKLLQGDTVLADRGFDMQDTFGVYGVKLQIPSFTRGKQQLSAMEVETTRVIASVRIHVERVIGVVRQKYTMLEGTIPITLLKKDNTYDVTTLDKIVHVSCALVNTCMSVIPPD